MTHESRRATASDVYNQIDDGVLDSPQVSYEKLIAYLAAKNGMYVDEFEKRFKKCRKVYEKACKEYRAENENRLRIKLKMNGDK